MKQTVLRKIASLLSLVVLGSTANDALSTDYWVDPRDSAAYLATNAAFFGTGTSHASPYYGNFDAIIANSQPGDTYHLLPGIFWTAGYTNASTNWKSNFRLIGSGKDNSIIRCNNPGSGQRAFIWTTSTNITISDFTMEWIGSPSGNVMLSGALLRGSDSKAVRINVKGLYGKLPNNGYESFGISVGSASGKRSLISECEITDVKGDYVSALLIAGEGVGRNNYISFPENQQSHAFYALTTADAINTTYYGNYVENAQKGYWSDTGNSQSNIAVVDNHFRNVQQSSGFNVAGASQQWSKFAHIRNYSEAFRTASQGSSEVFINAGSGNNGSLTNLYIVQNVQRSVLTTNSSSVVIYNSAAQYQPANVSDVIISDNVWPFAYSMSGSNYRIVENKNEIAEIKNDNPWISEENAIGALPTKVWSISSWPANNQMEREEVYLIVNGTGSSQTVKLPQIRYTPDGSNFILWSGRQVTIVNRSNASITVSVSDSAREWIDNANSTSASISIATNLTPLRFISGNDGRWYLH